MYASATMNPYETQAAQTASPAQLTLMLFEGAVAAVKRARSAWQLGESGSVETINRELQRAQSIVEELQFTLDRANGGAIADNLDSLYSFCIDRLLAANVSKDLSEATVVESTLDGLREAWETICTGMAEVS